MLKRFGFAKSDHIDREPVQMDVQQILAYLEELARLRTLLQVHVPSDPPALLSARVELVNDQDFLFSLSFPHQVPRLKPGESVELNFPLAGMRFKAQATYHDRGRYMESLFKVPRAVHFADRRSAMRTRIGSREKASAAVFESFFEGVAASGRLLNISMEGLCLRMEKAIQVQGSKRLALHPELFPPGKELQIVRIMNLPHLPTIECSGEVRYCASTAGGPVLMGIRLEGIGSLDHGNLHKFMLRRLPTFGRAFPSRQRRGSEEEAPEEEPDASDQETETSTEPAVIDPAFGDEVDAPGDPVFDALESPSAPSEDRLLRLRRRGKRFLVIMPDDLDRSIFVCTLHVGGYTCFFESRNLVHGLELSKKAKLDAIFLDQQIGPLTGNEVAQRLRKMGRLEGVPIFQLMQAPDVRAVLSAKAAGVNHVVKVPVDFDGELKHLLDRTLGLTKQ
ncbi:response regulator [Geothrix sp. PMB-07]|uniref:response regulator n=1 Tax=Geothrix sp. PMB-07 TaxID=3068640 RepID=UPI002740A83E|nr:response regulator [Geothrix sp. PMB-07]WLT30356.1 response regulator [Geothrix sp. PMB-07]